MPFQKFVKISTNQPDKNTITVPPVLHIPQVIMQRTFCRFMLTIPSSPIAMEIHSAHQLPACMRVSPDREISSILSWEWGPDGAALAGHAIYPLCVAFQRTTLSSELMGNSMGEQTGHTAEPASHSNTYGSIYTYQNVICDQICFVGKRPIQSHFLRLCPHEI